MSKSKQEISNPSELIERFGGIRPMAKKMGAAVTTVQGWKKRGTIPASRTEEIIRAGEKYDIKLDDLIASNTQAKPVETTQENTDMPSQKKAEAPKPAQAKPKAQIVEPKSSDEILAAIELAQKENRQQSVWIAIALIVMTIVAGSVLLAPNANKTSDRLDGMEEQIALNKADIEYVEQDNALLKNLLPEDWDARISDLRDQADQTRQSLEQAAAQAEQATQQALNAVNSGDLGVRLGDLEAQLRDLAGEPVFANLIGQLETLQGQVQFDQITMGLNALVQNVGNDPQNLNQALSEQIQNDPAMAQAFAGVPQEDLKAAAVLFGLNQFRAALNRDGQPFAGDLELVSNLVAGDNPEFAARLQTLAPHAESGVLTVGGLSAELRTIAGDAVVASLQGEDVSVQDRAQARLNELFSVQQNGELVTGTDTQATVARAQGLIDQGNLEQAMGELSGLQGPEAQVLQPFLNKLQAGIDAQSIQAILSNTINANAFGTNSAGGARSITASGAATGAGTFYRDEKSGLVIYKP